MSKEKIEDKQQNKIILSFTIIREKKTCYKL
jgi:hypothetical protein